MYLYIVNTKIYIAMENFKRSTDFINYGTFSKLKGQGVYQIRCIEENKCYIGSSKDCQERVQKHFSELRFNRHTNKRLQEAFNKYGIEGFIYSIVLYVAKEEDLLDKETEYQIKIGIDNLYNDKITGYYISDELKARYANIDQSYKHTLEYRMKLASSRQNNKIARCDYATGKILYVYENFVHLKEANPNVKRSTLLSACNGNKKSAYGYKWKYVPMDIPTGEYHEID